LKTSRKLLASGISEAEAIDRAKLGDIYCFEQLYGFHKRRVYSLCLRMVGDVEVAEDLTQEAFLLLFRKIVSFRGDSAFSTWLYRLTVNVVLMHVRKKGLSLVSLDDPQDLGDQEGPRKEIASHDGRLVGAIDRVILDRAIKSLAPGYRIILVLHDVEGYEHNEIAEMLGFSVGNSKSQLHKARTRLRTMLNITRAENLRHKAPRKLKALPEVNLRSASAAAGAAA
jgi:RNA polymerase sigma-70 factor (ECF subfamily)